MGLSGHSDLAISLYVCLIGCCTGDINSETILKHYYGNSEGILAEVKKIKLPTQPLAG